MSLQLGRERLGDLRRALEVAEGIDRVRGHVRDLVRRLGGATTVGRRATELMNTVRDKSVTSGNVDGYMAVPTQRSERALLLELQVVRMTMLNSLVRFVCERWVNEIMLAGYGCGSFG